MNGWRRGVVCSPATKSGCNSKRQHCLEMQMMTGSEGVRKRRKATAEVTTMNWWISGFILLNQMILKKELPWGGFSGRISHKRNERLQSQLKSCWGGARPPHCHTLSYSHRVPAHDTKPEAPLFTVCRGRSTLSWMGRIRYVPLLDEGRSTRELRWPLLLYDADQQTSTTVAENNRSSEESN